VEIWVVLWFDERAAVVAAMAVARVAVVSRKVAVGVVNVDFLGFPALVVGRGGGLSRGDMGVLLARGFRFALGGHESEK